MKKDIEAIFSDKIRLSATVVAKEFDLIEMYNSLFKKIKQGELEEIDVILSEHFFLTWQNLLELYEFLEFDYARGWGKIADNTKEYELLLAIIKKYRTLKTELKFSEIANAYVIIRKIMAYSGFHDVSLNTSFKSDFLKPRQKWSPLNLQ